MLADEKQFGSIRDPVWWKIGMRVYNPINAQIHTRSSRTGNQGTWQRSFDAF